MKCVKKGEEIKNLKDEEAFELVRNHGYEFCSRKEWKEKVRDKFKK